MISFSNINKQYGKQLLFVDASFQLNPGEKVGLVGPNGAGKTTLFRMAVGEETPDEGAVSVPKKLTGAPHISRTLRRQAPPKHRRQQPQGNRRNQRPGQLRTRLKRRPQRIGRVAHFSEPMLTIVD